MGILVGFHVEGWDHLILRSFAAVLLDIPEDEIVPDSIEASGRGWQYVLATLSDAIRRFYQQCAQFAVIGVDNDGNVDLSHKGTQEDPGHLRHWNHGSPQPACRFCQIESLVARARTSLPPLPQKPPQTWPVLVAVPVEAIEAWVLELQAIVDPATGLAQAERRGRVRYKSLLYGSPAATRQGVERVALPLIRSASPEQIKELRGRSRSFELFAKQIDQCRATLLGPRDCWAAGDGAAVRV